MRASKTEPDSSRVEARCRQDPRLVLALCALGWLSAAGCGPSDSEAEPPAVDREALAALGYLDWSPADTDSAEGVVVNQSTSDLGYNLYNTRSLGRADLIDLAGCVLKSWQDPGEGAWSRTRLLENGDLAVIGAEDRSLSERTLTTDLSGMFLMRLTFDGNLLWKKEYPAHHDVAPVDSDRLLVLTQSWRELKTQYGDTPVRDNGLALLTAEGEELERLSLYDILSSGGFPFRDVPTRLPSGSPGVDLLHANSVVPMTIGALPSDNSLYGPNNVIVTLRAQNAVVILDRTQGRLVWHWGSDELLGPHNATALANGNLLIFDNRRGERASRVIELDPLAREIVWRYRAPTPEDFYSASRGAAQRLTSGNTLVTQSDSGRAFEITPRGRIVWEFLSPYRNDRGQRAIIGRMERIHSLTVRRLFQDDFRPPIPGCSSP